MDTPDTCPNCGAELSPKDRACPECGSCEETGWSDHATEDRLGIPSSDFDYKDYLAREFGPEPRRRTFSVGWLVVAVVLVLVLLGLVW